MIDQGVRRIYRPCLLLFSLIRSRFLPQKQFFRLYQLSIDNSDGGDNHRQLLRVLTTPRLQHREYQQRHTLLP